MEREGWDVAVIGGVFEEMRKRRKEVLGARDVKLRGL